MPCIKKIRSDKKRSVTFQRVYNNMFTHVRRGARPVLPGKKVD